MKVKKMKLKRLNRTMLKKKNKIVIEMMSQKVMNRERKWKCVMVHLNQNRNVDLKMIAKVVIINVHIVTKTISVTPHFTLI